MSYNLKDVAPSVRAQINAAGLPMKTVGLELSDLRPYANIQGQAPVLDSVEAWLNSVRSGNVIKARGTSTCGLGLLLVGKPGHGKTTLASTALQELLRTIPRDVIGTPERLPLRPAYFTDYPKLLRLQKRNWEEDSDNEIQNLIDGIYGDAPEHLNIKVLVLDDIGKEYRTASGWAENTFDALLRARFNAGLPTIVTTNVPIKDWGDTYGQPMGSFVKEAFMPIVVESAEGDRRAL